MNRVDWCPVVLRHLSLRLTRFNPKPLPYTRANSKKNHTFLGGTQPNSILHVQ